MTDTQIIRLLLLTDFTESYSYKLFAGIQAYAQEHGRWAVCRMPPSYKSQHGLEGVLKWAKAWSADALIGRFDAMDRTEIFPEAGILTFAQDYKVPISSLPSITGGYREAGAMAADYFITKGFSSFAFVGYRDAFWSQERYYGFRSHLEAHGLAERLRDFRDISIDEMWDFRQEELIRFLRSLPHHTALFACDDNEGIRIAELCRAYDIEVPQRIAILGVDDDQTLCNLSDPPLSSIALDVTRGGYEVAKQIDARLSGRIETLSDVRVSPVSVSERASTNILSIDDKEIAKVIEYIHKHANSPISVPELMKLVPLSRRQLEIRFKRSTHETILRYIQKFRVDRFARLLIETDRPISELCEEMGFGNPKNLSRQFRTVMGTSPQEYRRSHETMTSYDRSRSTL